MGERIGAMVRERWRGYLVALAAVAALSLLIGGILAYRRIGNLPMLYLLAVLIAAIRYGRGPAIAASIAAFLAFDWFFIPPFHTLTVADPAEWVSLGLFLLTAIVTAQLAVRERERAEDAGRRERQATVQRGIGIALIEADRDLVQGIAGAEARLRRDFDLALVCIVLNGDPAPPDLESPPDATRRRALPLLAPGGERIGTLTAARASDATPFTTHEGQLLDAVATQLGTLIERVRLRREATEADTLRRTDELKSALLNAVSHDLRTPLAAILASAGSLRQRDIVWSEEERGEFALAIVEEAERLNGIVGNLLDLSRIEGGSLRPDKDWHDLGTLIADVTRRVRARYPEHHFAVDVQDDLPSLLIDWVEIDQVLSNLVENAAKYSPAGTKVWISARRDGAHARVQIADRGPGIPKTALQFLFTPFYRILPRNGRTGPKGTGLGLAVARGLVEAHGGTIAVRNRDDGGALFTFTLPLPTPEEAANPPHGMARQTVGVPGRYE